MAEKIIYQNGDVSVSNSKVVFGGNSYFMKNIVSIRVVKVPQRLAGILMLIGIVMAFGALNDLKEAWWVGLMGAGLIFAAIKMGFSRWVIHFDTSSGSVNAYHGKKELMFEIKSKIEEAMTITE